MKNTILLLLLANDRSPPSTVHFEGNRDALQQVGRTVLGVDLGQLTDWPDAHQE